MTVRSVAVAFVLSVGAGAQAQPAPGCALKLQDGGRAIDLRQLKGKVVYVDFWASWCTSCVLSFPFMNQLDSAYRARGLQVLAVDMDETASDGHRFLERHPAGFSIAEASSACARAFGVKAMPSSFLIDRHGALRAARQGFRPGEASQIRAQLEQLLAERGD